MQVSVIIPVFNAVRFLEEAVQSALSQPETAEVLLIEDGSADDSLAVCQALSGRHPRIRLLTHSNNQNLGASASRNRGIANATCDYIAFLDADDLYLPARFAKTAEMFRSHPDADGIHETIGAFYSSDVLRMKHLGRVGNEQTGIDSPISSEKLFDALATGKHGHIHLNGLVVRKQAIDHHLLFDVDFRQAQDSDWILRLAASRRLYQGTPGHPVAMRRVHSENRVLNTPETIRYQRQYLKKCISNHFYGSRNRYSNFYIVARYVSWMWDGKMRRIGFFSQPCIIMFTFLYLITHPGILYQLIFIPRK